MNTSALPAMTKIRNVLILLHFDKVARAQSALLTHKKEGETFEQDDAFFAFQNICSSMDRLTSWKAFVKFMSKDTAAFIALHTHTQEEDIKT